jgi:hypothetical protein
MTATMRKALISLTILVVALLTWASAGAQEGVRVDITGVDTSDFPLVALDVIAVGQNSRRLGELPGLAVTEAGQPVEVVDIDTVSKGVHVFFVIDANRTFNTRDAAGGPTRREVVRDGIIRFAEAYMSQAQLDRVSIIVPDGDQPRLLLSDAAFPTEVINEVNFYETGTLSDTPLNAMLSLAISQAAERRELEERFQAVVLFSDAGQLNHQLEYESLVAGAEAIGLPIFVGILGASADPNEIENARGLYEPTLGNYAHVPLPDDAAPIYDQITENSAQSRIVYRSRWNTSEPHLVTVEVQGVQASRDVSVEVGPAEVAILLESAQTIHRVVPNPTAPIGEAEPRTQPVPAQVLWPDGHPRQVTGARLLVNGAEQASMADPDLGPNGTFALDWNLSQLGDGNYELVVEVDDELGLVGSSPPVGLSIVIEGVGVAEEVAPVEPPTAVPAGPEQSTSFIDSIGLLGIIVGILAIMVAIVLIVVAVMLMQQRRQGPEAGPLPAAADDFVDHTQILRPAFAAGKAGGAYLEGVENASEHAGSIDVPPQGATLGRDPRVAKVVFKDKSVSRLHARIAAVGGVYQLFDEGSASGTYVNYEQVGLAPQTLKDGDDIHLGRVHLRFRVPVGADEGDSTQVMPAPMAPERPQPAGDDLSTQPYMAAQPQAKPEPRPPAQRPPDRPAPPAQQPADDDEDDISTEPFMPHTPRR